MRNKRKWGFLACLLISCMLLNTIVIHASTDTEDPIIGYLTQENPQTRAVNNSSTIPIYSSSYGTFWAESGIKYINNDDQHPDSLGKRRLIYCLEHNKSTPTGNITFTGWQNKRVGYALYYGCMYWGETCRYAPYSTGDWKLDYTATQAAIWVLTGEFSLDHAVNEIIGNCTGPATQEQRQLVAASCKRIVNDASNDSYYTGWNSDGWFDLSLSGKTTFLVSGYQDTWTNSGDGYYRSGGAFSVTFKSYFGYDMRNQIKSMNITVPDGVNIRKANSSTFSDFDLYISEEQYLQWQKTGKDIPVTITITLPREWSAAIYSPPDDTCQKVTFLTYRTPSDTAVFTKTITLHIPQAESEPLRTLTIHKNISQDDIWWAHGSPVFFFCVTGTDTDGTTHSYTRALTYTKEYVASNTASDGTITLSTAIKSIPAGTYTIKEQKVSRFVLTDVTAQTDNIQITKQAMESSYAGIVPITANINADLTQSDGEVTFYNRKITWDQYSHKDITINSFSLQQP